MLSTTVTRKYGLGPTWSKQLYFFSWRRSKSQCMKNSKLHDHAYPLHSPTLFKNKLWTKWLRNPRITDRLLYIYTQSGAHAIWCLNFPSGSDPKWISYASMLGGRVLWYTVVFFATSKQVCKSRADSRMRVECAKPGRDGRKGKWHPESGTSPWKGPGAFVDLSDQIDSYWF